MKSELPFEILIPFEKSETGAELRLFSGIASSTSVDRDNERMDKSVIDKIASELRKNSTVFFNHDTKGLGVGTIIKSESEGGKVHIDVRPTQAKEMEGVVTQIREGVLKSFSIGGRIKDYENEFDEKLGKNVRVIKDVDVFEVSVVGVPSNTDASILSYFSKSFQGGNMDENKSSNGPGDKKEAGECPHSVMKCMKCNTEIPKTEPALGPGELSRKAKEMLDTPEFKKILDDTEKLQKAQDSRIEEMRKSFDEKEKGYMEKLAAANARIDLLHEEAKGKGLQAEEDELQKAAASGEKEQKTQKAFVAFPAGKAF